MAPHNSSTSSTEPLELYPFNRCGHLRAPDGACMGFPECKQEPADPDQLREIQARAAELLRQLGTHGRAEQTGAFVVAQLTTPNASSLPTAESLSAARVGLGDSLAAAESLARSLVVVLLVASQRKEFKDMPPVWRRDFGIIAQTCSMRLDDLRVLRADAQVLLGVARG